MRFDSFGCLVREKPREPGHEIANLGDSCADTCRAYIMGYPINYNMVLKFADWHWRGFLRHPNLKDINGWDHRDFTVDQLIPLMMAQILQDPTWARNDLFAHFGFVKGTWKPLQPAVYAILWRKWWLLDLINRAQGFLLGLPFRWSDDESEGAGFKSSTGKVQDYLNMIAIYIFLRRIGYKATLPRPVEECIKAVRLYRQGPKDYEPNADWEIELYESALGKN